MPPVRLYFHLYLDGDARWQDIAAEYAAALTASGFPAAPRVGIVGRDRAAAARWLDAHGWALAAEADRGYEQVTLRALHADARTAPPGTAVLYTHSKGAWRNIWLEDQWRRSMLWHVVFGWRACVALLDDHDAAGCHWMGTHFAGNFWWARAGYLAGLDPPGGDGTEATRGRAETWIGEGRPRVANLVEGFASAELTEPGALLTSARLPARPIARRGRWVGDPR